MKNEVKKQLEIIKRGTVEIYSENELAKKIEHSLETKKPLRVKLGVDPTAPDIHLGLTVVLRKLRQFQDLGHRAILIIGDFTASIGDPSDTDKTRPRLSSSEIEENARTYFDQVGKILELKNAEIVKNSEWLGKLKLDEIIKLAARVTVARMIERDDFAKRLKKETPIGLHELLYPLVQAYDSVAIKADIELGGTDQTFNLLTGRDLQRSFELPPQVAITMPLLVGLDGTKKMSKSLNNYIGVTEDAHEMFGKTMSIPDKLMKDYFTLLTDLPKEEIEKLIGKETHPKEAKVRLGKEIVTMYHDKKSAEEAVKRFEQVFAKQEMPAEIPEVTIKAGNLKTGNKIWLPKLLNLCGFVKSNSEGKRLVVQGGVQINEEKLTDPELEIALKSDMILKVGKKNRFCRIRITD
ncbi:MAG: tyrosine--tRNA ligase [Planctomycetes bacterium]|nr:tyrosine--tRNA ligase [Planctomycetota bacterium]